MRKLNVSLGGPLEFLHIEYSEDWSYVLIQKEDTTIGEIKDIDALKQGRSFYLPDRSQITVVLSEFGLEVWQNGKELVSGGKSKSIVGFSRAANALFYVGIANIVLSGFAYMMMISSTSFEKARLKSLAIAFLGLVLIGLGFWAKKTGSKIPFWIGIGLACLNILATLAYGRGGILVSGILIYYLYKGTQSEPPVETQTIRMQNEPLDHGF